MNARPVTIERRNGPTGGCWCVVYQDRKYRGRYWAATFDARFNDIEKVKNWVRANPKLVLEDRP